MFSLIFIRKKIPTMVTKYRRQVKWGYEKKTLVQSVCGLTWRPADTVWQVCVCGWKVPALSTGRYINGGYSHNPSRAAGEPLQLSEGGSIRAGLLQKNPSNSKHMSESITLPLPQDRCKSPSESRGQWGEVFRVERGTQTGMLHLHPLCWYASARHISNTAKVHRARTCFLFPELWGNSSTRGRCSDKSALHRSPLVWTSISLSPYVGTRTGTVAPRRTRARARQPPGFSVPPLCFGSRIPPALAPNGTHHYSAVMPLLGGRVK